MILVIIRNHLNGYRNQSHKITLYCTTMFLLQLNNIQTSQYPANTTRNNVCTSHPRLSKTFININLTLASPEPWVLHNIVTGYPATIKYLDTPSTVVTLRSLPQAANETGNMLTVHVPPTISKKTRPLPTITTSSE